MQVQLRILFLQLVILLHLVLHGVLMGCQCLLQLADPLLTLLVGDIGKRLHVGTLNLVGDLERTVSKSVSKLFADNSWYHCEKLNILRHLTMQIL